MINKRPSLRENPPLFKWIQGIFRENKQPLLDTGDSLTTQHRITEQWHC